MMLSFVHHVALQFLLAVSSEGTLVTEVSRLVLVNHCPLVSVQCPPIVETRPTVFTFEWFQVCVDNGVKAEIFLRTELFEACWTFFISNFHIRRIVNLLMLFQVGITCEGFLTDLALDICWVLTV